MKKQLIAALALVAAAIGATTPSWAFQSVQKATVTAGTFVGGQKVARFTLAIRDVSNPFNGVARSSITWSGVNAGDGWKIADRLLVLNSTVTDANGGIQIYTENTAPDASPQFVDPTPAETDNPDSVAAGLLQGLTGTTSNTLPMAWSIKSGSRTIESGTPATGIGATDPNNGPETGFDNKFQWLFVTDRYNASGIDFDQDDVIVLPDGVTIDAGDAAPFVDGAKYQAMVRAGGLHATQDSRPDPLGIESTPDGQDAYVYFEANFAGALPQTAYQTTALRVEAYIQ